MTNIPLTRTCSSCGIKKPLSAFLQISGTKGTTYGSICSSCRGAEAAKKNIVKEDEHGSIASGVTIGTKERVQVELKQKQQQQDLKHAEKEEQKKELELTEKKLERSELTEKTEKDRRESYLKAKQKQSFLAHFPTDNKQPVKKFDQKIFAEHSLFEGQQRVLETEKKEKSLQEEIRATTVDLTAPFIAPHSAQQKYGPGTIFQAWAKSMQGHAPIMRMINLLYGEKNTGSEQTPTESEPEASNVEKTSGPSSRRR